MLAAILVWFAPPASAHSDWCGYDFTQISVPNTKNALDQTSLADINNDRLIIGGFADSSGQPFLLNGGLFKDTIQLPGQFVNAQSINNRGVIVGTVVVSGTGVIAWVRDQRGHYGTFTVPNATRTRAVGISNNGYIVGDYHAGGSDHGFLLTDGVFETIDAPFAGRTALVAINRFKDIVGFTIDAAGVFVHSFVLSNGVFTPVEVPGAFTTEVVDINDRGQILGNFAETDPRLSSSFERHGFVMTDGEITVLDAPFLGAAFTQVSGINDRGEVVGRVFFSDGLRNIGFTAVPRDCGAEAVPRK
jgi:uncharacterized membrane protein